MIALIRVTYFIIAWAVATAFAVVVVSLVLAVGGVAVLIAAVYDRSEPRATAHPATVNPEEHLVGRALRRRARKGFGFRFGL
jgi:hypothetical protein